MVLADPSCTEAVVNQKVLTNRNSVLFWVRPGGEEVQGQIYLGSGPVGSPRLLKPSLSHQARLLTPLFLSLPQVMLRDKSFCLNQGVSGLHLKKTSMLVKVRSKPGWEGR